MSTGLALSVVLRSIACGWLALSLFAQAPTNSGTTPTFDPTFTVQPPSSSCGLVGFVGDHTLAGGWTAFETAAGRPLEVLASGADEFDQVSSISSSFGELGLSPSHMKVIIGSSWATWGHGYAGEIFWTQGATSATLMMPPGVGAYDCYIEPNTFSFQTFSVTGTASGNSTATITVTVDGSGGASHFGFYSIGGGCLTSISITGPVDWAIGEFRLGYCGPGCDDLLATDYGQPDAPGLLILLDRSESMLSGTRSADSITASKDDINGFGITEPNGKVAVWTFNGGCATDWSEGFIDRADALALLDDIETGTPSGCTPLADAMDFGIQKLFMTYPNSTPRYLAVSSAGEESSSTGPCSGPDAASGDNCADFTLGSWQQKICEVVEDSTFSIMLLRKWDSIPGPSDRTESLFRSITSLSGGMYQRVVDGDELPRSFFQDCNGNGAFDFEDIASGTSLDSDGSGVPDECESFYTNYCIALPNSTGLAAHISGQGSSSISANDLLLRAERLPVNQFGLFFYGQNQVQLAFGNGYRCVGGQVFRRHPLLSSSTGILEQPLDYSDYQPGGQILPGSTWNFQAWYRDPMGGGASFNLSEGMSISFLP